MATVTSRRAKPTPKVQAQRLALCKELLTIEAKLIPDLARYKVIETALKKDASDVNDSFMITVPGLGTVAVAPAKEAEFKGNVPQIQTEKWLALKPAERKALEKSGLVKMEPEWGSKSYGRVTPKLL